MQEFLRDRFHKGPTLKDSRWFISGGETNRSCGILEGTTIAIAPNVEGLVRRLFGRGFSEGTTS